MRRQANAPGTAAETPPGMCIGDPDQMIATLKEWESTGIDCVNFLLNANETIPQADVLASLELFARKVMPKFSAVEAAA